MQSITSLTITETPAHTVVVMCHLSVSLSVCLRLGGHINRMSNLRLRKRIYGELQAWPTLPRWTTDTL